MKTPNPEVDPLIDAAFDDATFIDALRRDLPSADDAARVRARLFAAGMVLGGAAASTSSAAAASGIGAAAPLSGAGAGAGVSAGSVSAGSVSAGSVSAGSVSAVNGALAGTVISGSATGAANGLGAGAAAVVAKVGLLSKIAMLPIAAKIGAATTLAVAVAASGVPLVLDRSDAPTPRQGMSVGGVEERAAPAATSAGGAPEVPSRSSSLGIDAPPVASTPAASTPKASTPAASTPKASTPAASTPKASTPKASTPKEGAPSAPTATTRAATGRATSTPNASARGRVTPHAGSAADRAPPAGDGNRIARGSTEPVRASTLAEETQLLERVMLAMGEGDRELARRLLDEHARRFPAGLLERERERALTRLRETSRDGRSESPH